MDDSLHPTTPLGIQPDTLSPQSTSGSESEDEGILDNFQAGDIPPLQCRFQHPPCRQPRRARPDGTLHDLCDGHRRQASHTQRRQHQRDRLLRVLINALQQQEDNDTNRGQQRRRRPRLVLLGNQGTLILGVVLSERGELQDLENPMP